ncbi:hypothetical protein AAHA92_31511 [Salvia divinorum]|uniref:Uncharacterized protein n=1 Tax=Salvia divinorum TaxID=28513 RepID=A0ABD1FQI6_SALDI
MSPWTNIFLTEGDREGTGYHPSSHTPIHLIQFESTLLKSRQVFARERTVNGEGLFKPLWKLLSERG